MIEPDIAFACDAILPRPASRKLIIQIPCYNEAGTLAIALGALPRSVPGFDAVEWLIIDDGSTDATVAVARAAGADHIVSHPVNRGLAAAFKTGLETALSLGADVIVNTDADNQYDANDIPTLTRPILDREADMVVGARPINDTEHFSWVKKRLQVLGSWVVRAASKTQIADAPSGFRAFTAEAAMRLNVFGAYTYTLETIIQAGLSDLKIVSVPIRTNPDLRPSRLVRSIPSYVRRSVGTIFHMFLIYRPLALFVGVGMVAIMFGLILGLRFLYFLATNNGEGHIQSVVLAALAIILGSLTLVMAMIANLIAVNRKLGEQILFRVRRLEQMRNLPERNASTSELENRRKQSS
ncbi:glycosyltransferase family 2 protein [Pinirhizobacter soli]|uniref:glycosyltransferase family 2 protein n=1 Tax=Pinirhizobacter soli TaxID=2786953 RepID=UPI00202AA607|nr:glycosyltransferase family 2 protein [Pinirhizobacter soli]